MKDCTNKHHSPIPMQAILSSRKTPNQAVNIRENTLPTDHLIHHLNHLINHLNQIGLQDLSQRWQNNTSGFCKHCRKLEANPDSRAEVLCSSSVLLTSIQAEWASILVFSTSHQVSCQPDPCDTCTSMEVSRRPQLLFFCQITGKNSILV